MESKTELEKLIDNYQKETQQKKEIVNALNSLIEIIFNNFEKLVIHETDYPIIFDLVKLSLNYIEKSANEKEDNFDSIIAIVVFRVLFMGKSSFKMTDLDKKINSFKLVLELFQSDTSTENASEFVEMRKYELFENIALEFDCDYYYSYCMYLIYKYSESKIMFLDNFINFMKKSFKDEYELDLEIRKDANITEEELKKIAPDNLLKNLNNINNEIENYIVLKIDKKSHLIKKELMSPEEVAEKLKKNNELEDKKNKRIKKKTKENNKVIEKENNGERRPFEETKLQEESQYQQERKDKEENKSQEESKYQEENTEKEEDKDQEENLNPKENKHENEGAEILNINNVSKNMREEDFKTIMKNTDNKGDNSQDLSSLVNGLLSKIKELEEKGRRNNDILTEKMDEIKKDNDKLTRTIGRLTGKIDKVTKDNDILKGTIDEMTKDITAYKKKIKKHEKSFKNDQAEILKLKQNSKKQENELKLIKLRDVFKNIINIFCKAYNISMDLSYFQKIQEITKNIPRKKGKEEEWRLLNKFWSDIYLNCQLSNKNAHTIDYTLSIIDQVFEQVDPNGDMKNVKEILLKGNIEDILKKLAYNRMHNFDKKLKFKEEEKKIMESVNGLNNIYPSI